MAQIKQVGVGRKSIGTIDGITYYVRGGKTFARSTPTIPASVYNTPEAKLRQAIFKMVQMHMKLHLRTLRQTITPKSGGSASNRYYSMNSKALTAALTSLAEQYVNGIDVTITEIEAAIAAYAAEHPTAIRIASLSGYQEVYLTGEWPSTITLNAKAGDNTVIIVVNENGQQTTINANGSITVSGGESNSNGSNNTNGGTNTGGGTGSVTPSNPKLTINRTGTGSSSVTVGGNAVDSGAEVAANTEVSISVTPAEGATPTASLNTNAVTLTENEGVYSGSFQMPSGNATLVINSGGATSGGDDDMN